MGTSPFSYVWNMIFSVLRRFFPSDVLVSPSAVKQTNLREKDAGFFERLDDKKTERKKKEKTIL